MDRLKKYQTAIIKLVNAQAAIAQNSIDQTQTQAVLDTKNHHYLLLQLGWEEDVFLHHCLLHIDLKDGKVWVQQNWMDIDLEALLEAGGIDKSDIVAGFLPDFERQLQVVAA